MHLRFSRKIILAAAMLVMVTGCQHSLRWNSGPQEPEGPFTNLYQVPQIPVSQKLIVRPEKTAAAAAPPQDATLPEPEKETPAVQTRLPERFEPKASSPEIPSPPEIQEPEEAAEIIALPEIESAVFPEEVFESPAPPEEPVYEISSSDRDAPRLTGTLANSRFLQTRLENYENLMSLRIVVLSQSEDQPADIFDVTGQLLAGRGSLRYFWQGDMWKSAPAMLPVVLEGRTRDGIHFRSPVLSIERPGIVSSNFYASGSSFAASLIIQGLIEGDRIDFAYQKSGGKLTDLLRARKNPLFCELMDETTLAAACKAPLSGIRPGESYSFQVEHRDSRGQMVFAQSWEHHFEAEAAGGTFHIREFYIVPWKFNGSVEGVENIQRAWISFEKYGRREITDAGIEPLDVTEHLKARKGVLELEIPLAAFLPGFYFAYLNIEAADGTQTVSWEAPFAVKAPELPKPAVAEAAPASAAPAVESKSGLSALIEEEVNALSAPGASRLQINSFYTVGYGLYGHLEGISDLRHATLRTRWSFSNAQDFESQDVTEVLKIQKGDFKLKDFLLDTRKPGSYTAQLILRDTGGRTVKSPEVSFRVAGILETSEKFEQGYVFFMAQVAGFAETDRVSAVYRLKDVKIFGGLLNKQYEVVLECGDPNNESIAICYSTEKSKLNPWREYEYFVQIRDYQGNTLARTQRVEFSSHNQRINAIQQEAEKIEVKITSFKLSQNEIRAYVKGHLNMEKAQLKIKRLLPPSPAFSQVFDVTEQILSNKGALAHPVKDLKTGFYSCQLVTVAIDGTRSQSPEVSFQWAV